MPIIITEYASTHFKMLTNKVILLIIKDHLNYFDLFYKACLFYILLLLNLMILLLNNHVLCVCMSVETIFCVAQAGL